MSDPEVHAFVELVKRKQHEIVLEVAAGHAGASRREIEDVLRRRLKGTGATPANVAAWTALICETPTAAAE